MADVKSNDLESPQAFPAHIARKDTWGDVSIRSSPGLTKREYFAAICMQRGIAMESNGAPNLAYYRRAAECAVIAADALIAALLVSEKNHD